MIVRPFVQAKNFHKGRLKPVRLVVIHDMEAPERSMTAENVAGWFAGSTAPMASAHDCIDADSVVPCVRDEDTAFAAPGANADGIQLELAGYAAQERGEWLDPYSSLVLLNAAKRAAQRCKKYGLPARWLTPAQVRAGHKGICGHHDITLAYPERGGSHYDPGPNFPKAHFIELVKKQLAPPAPQEDDDMPTADEIAKAVLNSKIKCAWDGKERTVASVLGSTHFYTLAGGVVGNVPSTATTSAGAPTAAKRLLDEIAEQDKPTTP